MSDLKNKLYNCEQVPPSRVWDKITAALDESHIVDAFPGKLYNAEVAPPASAWDKIAGSLDPESPKVISIQRRPFPLLRYAAAIAVIGLIAFGIIKWTGGNNKPVVEGVAVTGKEQSPANSKTVDPAEDEVANSDGQGTNVTPEETITGITDSREIKAMRVKKAKASYASAGNTAPAEAIYAYEPSTNLADRYVMLMTPNGIVRMSKKLGDIVCCVAGEEPGSECRDQIKKYQEKLATSPAPGNFMDMLNLLSSMDDKEL